MMAKILLKLKIYLGRKKIIIISILPAVKPGMSAADFTNHIQSKIYSELDTMN